MNKITRRLLGTTTVAGLATLAPLSMDPGAAAEGQPLVRLTQACGQLMTCNPEPWYICSTHRRDWMDYRCATGCGS